MHQKEGMSLWLNISLSHWNCLEYYLPFCFPEFWQRTDAVLYMVWGVREAQIDTVTNTVWAVQGFKSAWWCEVNSACDGIYFSFYFSVHYLALDATARDLHVALSPAIILGHLKGCYYSLQVALNWLLLAKGISKWRSCKKECCGLGNRDVNLPLFGGIPHFFFYFPLF